MNHQPFCERVDIDHVLNDDRFSKGMAKLEFMAHSGSVALITGQTGVGKSTLIRQFVSGLKQAQALAIYIYLTQVKASSLLSLIVSELGETPRRGKDRLFHQILTKTGKHQQTTLLIIDEAHLLCNEALTDLRLMISSAMDERPPFKMVLIGQETLRRNLRQEQHADFANRISVHIKLNPLTEDQCDAYIDFQMKSAGSSDKVFEPEVKKMIHEYSNGVPRQINNIATGCLIAAMSEKSQKINREILNMVMDELN
jgi:general secretion pathway protein A